MEATILGRGPLLLATLSVRISLKERRSGRFVASWFERRQREEAVR
jgi:hypothetical protein